MAAHRDCLDGTPHSWKPTKFLDDETKREPTEFRCEKCDANVTINYPPDFVVTYARWDSGWFCIHGYSRSTSK